MRSIPRAAASLGMAVVKVEVKGCAFYAVSYRLVIKRGADAGRPVLNSLVGKRVRACTRSGLGMMTVSPCRSSPGQGTSRFAMTAVPLFRNVPGIGVPGVPPSKGEHRTGTPTSPTHSKGRSPMFESHVANEYGDGPSVFGEVSARAERCTRDPTACWEGRRL